MEINKLAILLISLILVTACGGSDKSNNDELSGMWRSEFNNTLYLILQNGNNISIISESGTKYTGVYKNGVITGTIISYEGKNGCFKLYKK